ncbi:MAG TPA: hypothetical protein ENI13_01080 [candidate division CPR3 bacterium]|uniref:Uncharacterized protein n=1 Tax=candidate division CPR3 bacterium TaxID=2268181 RepID=A0A7C1S9A1_UNCC3|nr:hypothetical protein [candidate division CPR3 bacterium]
MKLNLAVREIYDDRYVADKDILIRDDLAEKLGINNLDRIKLKVREGGTLTLTAKVTINQELNDGNHGFVNGHVFSRIYRESNFSAPETVTVGCDPEIFLFLKGKRNKAMTFSYLSNIYHRECGGGEEIGMDGAGFIGEFRPKPSLDPAEMTDNLKSLIFKADNIKKMAFTKGWFQSKALMLGSGEWNDWSIGGFSWFIKKPAGFHIHFGLPGKALRNREYIYQIVFALDYFLGIPCISVDREVARRSKQEGIYWSGRYGQPASHEISTITLEYRVPGAFLLRERVLSEGIITLGKLVVEDFLTRTKTAKPKWEEVESINSRRVYGLPDRGDICKELVNAKPKKLGIYMDDIRTKLEKMEMWHKYKNAITSFLDSCSNEYPSPDIVENWRKNENQERNMELCRPASHS